MKIMSLNVWSGRNSAALYPFLEKYKDEVDVFCFQEVFREAHEKEKDWLDNTVLDLHEQMQNILTGYQFFYHPHFDTYWGLSMFVRKEIFVHAHGDIFVHKAIGYNPEREAAGHTAKNVEYVEIAHGEKRITICNFHGLWNGQGKTDTEDRITQSKNIVNFLKTLDSEVIFCGDLNLRPETESMKILEASGLQNLIIEYGVTSTRTSLYKKPEKYADYILVSKGIHVKDFAVLPDEVSDHAALLLEI